MYHQTYDPLGNPFLSTLVAAIPILTLLYFIALHRHRDANGQVHLGISAPWAAFFGVLWGVHLTGWYEAALTIAAMHAAEHAVLHGTALLFWMPILRADPTPSRLSHPARILYLFLAMPAMAFLGLAIAGANDVLYPAYARSEGVAAALADQQRAGSIMWVGTMFLIVPALAFVLLDWMRADEREASRIDARLSAAAEGGP
jgi:cytochrome c oxidase assembly factor CtaG